MSQQNNDTQGGRQATGPYGSTNTYPSPSLQPQNYAYPPPQGVDSYRNSPSASNAPLPSLSLPPIRNIDPRQGQQSQGSQIQQGPASVSMGSSLPPSMPYYQQPSVMQSQMNMSSNQGMRYPLPASPDNRVMSSGRHKKEIKRRTKTGCLTCRKRRIKCDETHPVCRNCQKSKRECLGYDPIFKSQPGPPAIQPAPASTPSAKAIAPTTYPPPPPGYVPASSQGFAQSITATVDAKSPPTHTFDYSSANAIDPALEGASSTTLTTPAPLTSPQQPSNQDPKLTVSNGSVQPANQSVERPMEGNSVSMNDIFAVGRTKFVTAYPERAVPTEENREQIKELYNKVFMVPIDRFLETRWYGPKSLSAILENNDLCERFTALCKRYKIPPTNPEELKVTQSLEASVVWMAMCICRKQKEKLDALSEEERMVQKKQHEDAGLFAAIPRIEIVQALLEGRYLDTNPLSETQYSVQGSALEQKMKYHELEFWRLLGQFVSLPDGEPNSDKFKEIDTTLAECRKLLDSHENRDMLYSIAVIRHLGRRIPGFPDSLPMPISNSEDDPVNKVVIAKRFVEHETMHGTTQIVNRIADMAVWSWRLWN